MKLHYLFVAALVLFSPLLMADHEALRAEFKTIDANNDGYINLREAANSGFLLSNWEEVDYNSDQHIDVIELIEFDVAKSFVPPLNDDEPGFGAAVY